MKLWQRPNNPKRGQALQTGRDPGFKLGALEDCLPLARGDYDLYRGLRQAIPLVDAALDRIVRLTVGFTVHCEEPAANRELERFCREVPVAGGGGLAGFAAVYLDSLLTCGDAAGEMLPGPAGTGLAGLYNAPPERLRPSWQEGETSPQLLVYQQGRWQPARAPQWLLHTALRPAPGSLEGRSLLQSLPFVGEILLKVFRSVGSNFDRVGNLRYAVTYKPGSDPMDRAYSGEIARELAKEWAAAMEGGPDGPVRDFVAVGDVEVKVIGSDCQMLDTQLPVRQLLEQMVAKLGVPPFLLGLHWSTTERMAAQQVDLFTAELDYYRTLLEPVLCRICRTHLRLLGLAGEPVITWANVGLQDEVELANTRLLELQARQLEQELTAEAGH